MNVTPSITALLCVCQSVCVGCSADAPQLDVCYPAKSAKLNPGNPNSENLVRAVQPKAGNLRWAERVFGLGRADFGYEKIQFVEFNYAELLNKVKASPHFHIEAGTPRLLVKLPGPPDISLTLFDQEYPLKIFGLTTDKIGGMSFIHIRGGYSDNNGLPFTDIPGPSSWRLHINETCNMLTGEIRTSTHEIAIEYTPDMSQTVAVWVSRERLSRFPPVD